MKILFSFYFFLFTFYFDSQAQSSFDRQQINVGNIGVSVTNAGTVGNPAMSGSSSAAPSMQYPINSGIEHLFEGGLWLGAYVNGQVAVSTGSIDASTGYTTGASGFEYTSAIGNTIEQRSSLTSSDYYSQNAVSHQDYLIDFTDANTIVPGTTTPIADHLLPLGASVHLETYAWNYSFADYFVLLNYTITNNSANVWDSVYLGMWTDLVVRNLNVCTDNGSAFFSKGAGGYIDSSLAMYAFDVNGDPGYTNSYGAVQYLGGEWRNLFVHSNNAAAFSSAGFQIPKVNCNFWGYKAFGSGQFQSPPDDVTRYEKMKNGLDFTDASVVSYLHNPSNNTQLISVGPLHDIQPGETVNFVLALVCAKQIPTGGTTGATMDSYSAQTELKQHLSWARRTFDGEDVNENGILDAGEDLNNDGILEHYVLPEPPANPKVKIVASNNKVEIYWDKNSENSIDPISKKKDFEGYRIYRSNIGDDLNADLGTTKNLIQQWDKPNDSIGYDNGFSSAKLNSPVQFDGDTTHFYYQYTLDNLLNGWQYIFTITAFDEGDAALKLESLESSYNQNTFRVFSGTAENNFTKNDSLQVGVYPNPYRINAAWDGNTSSTKKIYFYNLPQQCLITVYNLGGDVVAVLNHDGNNYTGDDSKWFQQYAGNTTNRIFSGGEHAWNLLTESNQEITQGIYLFSVKDLKSGLVQQGRFAVIK